MDCCQCEGIEIQFDRKKAAKKLKKYRTKGPQSTTRALVDGLIEQGVEGATLLDIGGGIGAIQHELLGAGVKEAVNFEASTAYMEACKEEAERQGHGDKITHQHGDFAHLDEDVSLADVVTLERVICCYTDMPGLVDQSCAKTGHLLGIVIPHDVWYVKLYTALYHNLKFKLKNNPFRVFVYPTQDVEDRIKHNGFIRRFYRLVDGWQVMIYERVRSLEQPVSSSLN
jgi:magnesium-protoporphyrin O-methyltransferase